MVSLTPMNKQNILISACLVGNPVRYNGTDLLMEHPLLKTWKEQGCLFSICPEVSGGMSIPRAPAEIVSLDSIRVVDINQQDVTEQFLQGAQKTLEFALKNNCHIAIMTENSPSCGSRMIYDGRFAGVKKKGVGITTALLQENGIRVFNQHQISEAHLFLLEAQAE